jgi:molybdenum cofactor cytidylyltransferase
MRDPAHKGGIAPAPTSIPNLSTDQGSPTDDGSLGIVILAAGESARMGQPKQLLSYRGRTLLRHTVETALALGDAPVVVVLGAHADRIRPELADLRVLVVENPDWRVGMGTSLRAGLNALLSAHPEIAAALFLLCDQPHISPDLLRHMEMEWRQGVALIACRYETRPGVPALFAAAHFPELLALQGAEGARQVLAQHANEVVAIPFPAGAIDVDRPEDYAALLDT